MGIPQGVEGGEQILFLKQERAIMLQGHAISQCCFTHDRSYPGFELHLSREDREHQGKNARVDNVIPFPGDAAAFEVAIAFFSVGSKRFLEKIRENDQEIVYQVREKLP